VTTAPTSILVIDDSEGVRTMLSSVLHDQGYVVETVDSGKKAVESCKKSCFDIALIDVELPDMKGTELLNRLKKLHPKMIRIIITGYPTLEGAMKAVNERADGYMLKPFEIIELLELIKKLLAEKTNEYLSFLAENTRAIERTPAVKYQHPDKW
jgi:DNA-binding NtrC family response regulator